MRVVLFCHSLLSDWNHGNAHFLRGVVTELALRGDEVVVYEPRQAWSVENLVRDHGVEALAMMGSVYPDVLPPVRYDSAAALDLDEVLAGADLVLVHEWNDPEMVERIGRWRTQRSGGNAPSPCLLFHDTHHRSVTDPASMARFDLSGFDGVLAFGAAIKDVYERRGWARRVWVWHEAADVRVFRPRHESELVRRRGDVVWIGNWGDEERTAELRDLLLDPVEELGLRLLVHGVRYPEPAIHELARRGVTYDGWLPNFRVPDVLAAHTMTVHVPRRPYVSALPGIPTIRVFEALACGVPLISGWWDDVEGLFTPGQDFLVANDGAEMRAHMRTLLVDADMRRDLARHGRETILRRHTCAHRVDELHAIARTLGVRGAFRSSRPSASPSPLSRASGFTSMKEGLHS
jgi:spore maturation protein CgeB